MNAKLLAVACLALLLSVPAAAAPKGRNATPNPYLFDASGVPVGPLAANFWNGALYHGFLFKSDLGLFFLPLVPDSNNPYGRIPSYLTGFESSNCTGTEYLVLHTTAGWVMPFAALWSPPNTEYAAAGVGSATGGAEFLSSHLAVIDLAQQQERTLVSQWSLGFCQSWNATAQTIPLITRLPFPYAYPLRINY